MKGKENNVEYSRSQSDAWYKGEEPVASKMTSTMSFILSLLLHQQCLLVLSRVHGDINNNDVVCALGTVQTTGI